MIKISVLAALICFCMVRMVLADPADLNRICGSCQNDSTGCVIIQLDCNHQICVNCVHALVSKTLDSSSESARRDSQGRLLRKGISCFTCNRATEWFQHWQSLLIETLSLLDQEPLEEAAEPSVKLRNYHNLLMLQETARLESSEDKKDCWNDLHAPSSAVWSLINKAKKGRRVVCTGSFEKALGDSAEIQRKFLAATQLDDENFGQLIYRMTEENNRIYLIWRPLSQQETESVNSVVGVIKNALVQRDQRIPLGAESSNLRLLQHLVANVYGFKSMSDGEGVDRHVVLEKIVEKINDFCVVCFREQRGGNRYFINPCGHSGICLGCLEALINSSTGCPFCRCEIKGKKEFFPVIKGDSETAKLYCQRCFVKPKSGYVLLPCAHYGFCVDCIEYGDPSVTGGKSYCPECGVVRKEITQIYFP